MPIITACASTAIGPSRIEAYPSAHDHSRFTPKTELDDQKLAEENLEELSGGFEYDDRFDATIDPSNGGNSGLL